MTIFKDLLGKQDVSWGTGQYQRRGRGGFEILVDQVNAGAIPIIDSSERFTGTTVEAALGELLTADDLSDALIQQALDELIDSLGQDVVLSGGLYEYVAGMIDSSLDEALATIYALIGALPDLTALTKNTDATALQDGIGPYVDGVVESAVEVVTRSVNAELTDLRRLVPWWWSKKLHWAFPTGNYPQTAMTTGTGTAYTLTSAGAGANTDLSTINEQFASLRAGTSGTAATGINVTPDTIAQATTSASPAKDAFDLSLYAFIRLKLTSITNIRYRVMLGNALTSVTDDPWGILSTTVGGVAFNFVSSVSANWFVCGKLFTVDTPLGFNVNTGIPVVVGRVYNLEIVGLGSGATRTISFYIDGMLIYTETGNTTFGVNTAAGNTTTLSHVLIPTAAETKEVGFARMVWGCNASSQYTPVQKPAGLRAWLEPDIF